VFDPGAFPVAISIIESAVLTSLDMIDSLYQKGARNFLVVNVPDIGLSPAVKMFGDTAIATASILVASYNFELAAGLEGLKSLPGISIKNLDLHSIVTAVVESPEDFKISNTEEPCLIFLVEKDAECRKPKTYLFWDGIHPTAAIHELVGKNAAKLYKKKPK
jgi:phospholipase/lecithinase/hemolysin